MPLEPKKPLRIGLLGGTFNPVHHWHLLTAECAIEQLKLDEIHFIPNGDPPHKQGVVDAEFVCELLQAAISPNKRFKLSRCEVDRVGKSYTSDTLEYYKKAYGQDVELFYIIGSDNLQYMTTWHNHEEIFKMAKILVAPRDHEVVDLEMIRSILPAGATYDILDCPGSAISSSLIRERVARGLTYRYAVTDSVWLGIRYYGALPRPCYSHRKRCRSRTYRSLSSGASRKLGFTLLQP